MPAQIPELETMDEDQIIKEVLDKFVNCHEQTYEEFLSTFIHLSKEDKVTQRGLFGTRSSGDIFISVQLTHENGPNDHRLRSKAIFLRTSSQSSEEKQVDNFLEVEDLDMDEEIKPQMSKERGREMKREIETLRRENYLQYLLSLACLLLGIQLATPASTLTRNQTYNLSVYGTTLNQRTSA
uniref:Intraflagellar transport associated protein n=1 Tax=Myotis myotis TaxID=51298 RepID=A0A7J7VGM5_MYOMY|nr:hypothetical protein mMyoMyo1_001658 [Myotis myotis]